MVELKLQKIKVMMDPGHGGKHHGTPRRKCNYDEHEINLMIAKELLIELRENGATVKATRGKLGKNEVVWLSQRKDKANDYHADIFVSIHCNAAVKRNKDGSVKKTPEGKEVINLGPRGAQVYFFPGDGKRSLASKKLANCIISKLKSKRIKIYKEGLKEGSFTVIAETHMPAVLVETAFMTNPSDERLLNKEFFRKRVAAAICEGIIEYLTNEGNKIVNLKFNPPGRQDRSRLNEEYVVIKNMGPKYNSFLSLQDFAGWILEDRARHKFYFKREKPEVKFSWCSVLNPGEILTVYTGPGKNERFVPKRYCNYRMPIWNNRYGDTATLKTNTGEVVATYTYRRKKVGEVNGKKVYKKEVIKRYKTKEGIWKEERPPLEEWPSD